MKKIDLGQTITILANLGVIAGIVFLGIEIRQNTATVQGATYQALSDDSVNQYLAASTDPQLMELLVRAYQGSAGEDFSFTEHMQLNFYYTALLQRLENSFFQFQSGLADDRVFKSYGWNDGIFLSQHFADFWARFGTQRTTSPEFRDFFESRVELQSTDVVN